MSPTGFITRFDAEPEFWQFLSGLRHEDIITELIQNELDADSTHTRIAFDSESFSCEGNGKSIDEDGWNRLSFVRGAGQQAPRKRFRIGVKNHGLKTCFTLGDEIDLFSAGMAFKQTLYSDGPGSPPRPGTYQEPEPDARAPLGGCQVRVPYRTKLLATSAGEPLEFAAPSASTIEEIFERACEEIPSRFIGVIRPGIRERYTIELSHHTRGAVTYHFRCTARRRVRSGWLFTRICNISGKVPNLPLAFRENVFYFVAQVPAGSSHEIPQFYKAPNGFHAEIAWRINMKGAPIPSEGHLRYPIAYTGSGPTALTGLSVHYSGPFVSDQERHGATATAFNAYVIEACDNTLIHLLRDRLLPQHGPKSLELLIANTGPSSERLRSMTQILLQQRVVPLAQKSRSKPQLGPRNAANGTIKAVVVPSYTWAPTKLVPLLRSLCPSELDQIDARIPKEIVALLVDSEFSGWKETHVTFDEDDVLRRMQPAHGDPYFEWISDESWQRCLGNSDFSRRCLDVLAATSEKTDSLSPEIIEKLRKSIYLPDTHGTARAMNELYVGNEMPPALSVLGIPPLLNRRIVGHPLLKKRAWKLPTYSLSTFLQSADLNAHPETIRHEFFVWLRENWVQIPKQFNLQLATWSIWPDINGSLHTLEALCLPRNPKIAEILDNAIHLPSAELIHLLSRQRRTGITRAIRTAPSAHELASFYAAQIQSFPKDRALDNDEVARWRQLEQNLAILARDREIAAWLTAQQGMALARDAVLRQVDVLHGDVQAVSEASLLDRYLLDRRECPLDRIHPPRTQPSVEAIVQTLIEDSSRTEVLIPRLKALSFALASEGRIERPIENVACIPFEGRLVEPAILAFRGNRGDYWGQWKMSLSGKGLSADEQKYYRQAGVTSAEPDTETSLAFFQWLSDQPESSVQRHLEPIVRHFANERSVRTWWDAYDEIPCLPVEVGASLKLVSRKIATRRGSQVFVPDFEQLAEVIRADSANHHVLLAVISHPHVAEPIAGLLRTAGVQSLRTAAATPSSVTGSSTAAAPSDLEDVFRELRSSKMNNLRKRLSALEFPLQYLREDWRSRIDKVNHLAVAEQVSACFKIGRRTYSIELRSGFDDCTRVIWLKRGVDLTEALFEALVQRIFREGVPKFAASVLQTAVRWEYRERTFHLLETAEVDHMHGSDFFEGDRDEEPGETSQTHRPTIPDPTRNLPHPGPIPQKAQMKAPRRLPGFSGIYEHATMPPNDLEVTQIEDLKQNQYAWHCQVCLAEKTPGQLAPDGSYVALAENRRLIMEAEHADQKHAGGARNAGNLVLLCHFHHHQLGNALSRDLLTDGLRGATVAKTIEFRSVIAEQESSGSLQGWVISVCPPSLGTIVNFFFTSAHRQYWLDLTPHGNPSEAMAISTNQLPRSEVPPTE